MPIFVNGVEEGNVKFPASQSPSSDPNTLDDYEEGTWTPVLTFDTPGDLSVAYANQVGRYTRIGRIVHIILNLQTSTFTHSTTTGNCQITGLPFTAANATGGVHLGTNIWRGITKASYTECRIRVVNTTSVITLVVSGSGQTPTLVAVGDMPSAGTVHINGDIVYEV